MDYDGPPADYTDGEPFESELNAMFWVLGAHMYALNASNIEHIRNFYRQLPFLGTIDITFVPGQLGDNPEGGDLNAFYTR